MSGADSDYTRFPEDKPYPKANALVKDKGPKVDTTRFPNMKTGPVKTVVFGPCCGADHDVKGLGCEGSQDYPKQINVVPLTQKDCADVTLDKEIKRLRSEEDARPALSAFEQELRKLINRASMESMSNTPDLILAEYLNSCLRAFNVATRARERWYGREVF